MVNNWYNIFIYMVDTLVIPISAIPLEIMWIVDLVAIVSGVAVFCVFLLLPIMIVLKRGVF